jgi:hypothetical protein
MLAGITFEELPGTGLCVCGAAYFFEQGGAGVPGHFHCHRCGRRYSLGLNWTPGAVAGEPGPTTIGGFPFRVR